MRCPVLLWTFQAALYAAGCGSPTPGREPVCGDGVAEGDEACDRLDLRGETCESKGLRNGNLACTGECTFDTGICLPATVCGDGVAEGEEACDGTELRAESCISLGYYGGTLSCGLDCAFDLAFCEEAGWCGDGLLNAPAGFPEEACDDGNEDDWDGCTACERSELRVNRAYEEPFDPAQDPNFRLGRVAMGPSGEVAVALWTDSYVPSLGGLVTSLAFLEILASGQDFAYSSGPYNCGRFPCVWEMYGEPLTFALEADSEGNVLLGWWTCSYIGGESIQLHWLDPSLSTIGWPLEIVYHATGCDSSVFWPVLAHITGPTEAVVMWTESRFSGSPGFIHAQRYLLNTPLGEPFDLPLPESFPSYASGYPPVSHYDMAASSQGYLLAFSPGEPIVERTGSVHVRRYAPSGEWIGPDLLVSDELGPGAGRPRISAWPDGRFFVTYTRMEDATELSTFDQDVYGRLYESDGSPLTGEVRLNSHLEGDQGARLSTSHTLFPDVALCESGELVAFWIGEGPGLPAGTRGTFGRWFDSDGMPQGPERLVGSAAGREAGLLLSPRVAADPGCQRFAAVSANQRPPWIFLVARFNASLDLIGAEPW